MRIGKEQSPIQVPEPVLPQREQPAIEPVPQGPVPEKEPVHSE